MHPTLKRRCRFHSSWQRNTALSAADGEGREQDYDDTDRPFPEGETPHTKNVNLTLAEGKGKAARLPSQEEIHDAATEQISFKMHKISAGSANPAYSGRPAALPRVGAAH